MTPLWLFLLAGLICLALGAAGLAWLAASSAERQRQTELDRQRRRRHHTERGER